MARAEMLALIACITVLFATVSDGLGVNWGTMTSHPLSAGTVVEMLKANGMNKVKLFDADQNYVDGLGGTGIEVIVAIPNDMLEDMGDYDNAKDWVKENVTTPLNDKKVDIKYVAVGNEPFLKSYNGRFVKLILPALQNIQKALDDAGLGDKIKAITPVNSDVYSSPTDKPFPSAGDFRSDIHDVMLKVVKFLHSIGAPFVVNIYPFFNLYLNPNFPTEFVFFDNKGPTITDKGSQYTNVFDANFDTLAWALKKAGVPNMKIIVGEVGWPTDGDKNANVAMAKRFYDGFLKKMAKKEGTPLRPGPLEVYLFGLIDEDLKSLLPGNFERHWGIFRYDGQPKFPMDLTGKGKDVYPVGAKGVKYLQSQWCVLDEEATAEVSVMDFACSKGDCSALVNNGSCSGLNQTDKISYSFNMYFQAMDQDASACDFNGVGKVTSTNASQGSCLFPVQIESGAGRTMVMRLVVAALITLVVALVV